MYVLYMYVLYVSLQILHKRLTSESVVIFENFTLKVTDFSNNETSEQTDKLSRAVSNQFVRMC